MVNNLLLRGVPIDMLEGKTILLTGATGLIGTHFLYAFRDIYNRGVDINVLATGRNEPPPHLKLVLDMPFIRYRAVNLATELLPSYYRHIDIIIHASSYGQPQQFIKNAIETISLNTTVTIDLFKRLSAQGKFLFISSSEVYSGLYAMPIAEDMMGTTTSYHPRACYIEAKRCGEAIVNIFRENGVNAKSARLCLAYGEGTRKGDKRVLNELIKKAIVDKEIKLLDDGRAIRTYCYVGDAVNMMLRILLEGTHPVYNVGGQLSFNIAYLAFLIGKLTDTPVVFPSHELPLEGAPNMVKISIQRYIDEFGDREFLPIETGLKQTIEFQKTLYGDDIK